MQIFCDTEKHSSLGVKVAQKGFRAWILSIRMHGERGGAFVRPDLGYVVLPICCRKNNHRPGLTSPKYCSEGIEIQREGPILKLHSFLTA